VTAVGTPQLIDKRAANLYSAREMQSGPIQPPLGLNEGLLNRLPPGAMTTLAGFLMGPMGRRAYALPDVWRSNVHPSIGIPNEPPPFNTAKTWYRGMPEGADLDINEVNDATGQGLKGFYMTSDPHYADMYGDMTRGYHVRGPIKEVNIGHAPDGEPAYESWLENVHDEALHRANQEGYSGVRLMSARPGPHKKYGAPSLSDKSEIEMFLFDPKNAKPTD
jgi:hypothetical protein